MLRVAAEVGYSETAFLAPDGSGNIGQFRVRYFSPLAEVPFCGHATIASGVAIAERSAGPSDGGAQDPIDLVFVTNNGPVAISVAPGPDGLPRATLTSVPPAVHDPAPGFVTRTLALLDWHADELDPNLPPAVAFAGANHLIIAVRSLATLERLAYPFEDLKALMLEPPHDDPADLAGSAQPLPGA